MESISRGEFAILLLAGGQGTRLGVPYPKGMYDVELPSRKTLYQIQAERILTLERTAEERTGRTGGKITMYIMTSEHTKAKTADFFKQHDYFGLNAENVVLFEQRNFPCFTNEGKIILESKVKVSGAPDGNGGLYWALRHEKVIDDMEEKGVRYLHAYCVDNILVKVADPVFMGYAISKGAESANKVVEKAFPTEAVGVVCKIEGKVQVVEYSEIGAEIAEQRRNDGKLLFCAGNICNHFFTRAFLRRVCEENLAELPHHVAKKKIPFFDGNATVVPTEANGIKLEKFVFDVFQFSRSFVVWECLRDDEFSPLKNADAPGGKKDTPTTARRAVYQLHRRYLEAAGAKVTTAEVNSGDCPVVEISPLVSYAGENLERFKGRILEAPVIIN